MVGVAQLVRAEDCGSSGRGFKSRHSPQKRRRCETELRSQVVEVIEVVS